VPIIFGACASAATIVLLVGTGAGSSLTAWPAVQTAMQWMGVAWLSYLSWQIFSAPAEALDAQDPNGRLGLVGAAGQAVSEEPAPVPTSRTMVAALAQAPKMIGTAAARP